MGMRSTIAYTDKAGVTKVTSAQWVTQLDYNMSLDFASRKPDAADNARRVGEMFKSITDNYEHISSLDRLSQEEREKENISYKSMGDDTEFCAVGGQPRDGRYAFPAEDYTRGPELSQEERDRFITEYHMDDGIGASYDERDPGKLTYFYADDATGEVVMQEVTMAQIRAGATTKGYHNADSDEAFKKRLTKMKAHTRKEAAASKAKAVAGAGEEGVSAVASSTSSGGSGGGGGTGGSVHVNPETGKTGKCRAHKEPCPFGGESGTDNHYDTFEEARAAYEKSQGGGGLSSLRKS